MAATAESLAINDQWWRLSNLYWILTKDGEKVRFVPNAQQQELYDSLWHRHLVLKARQLGMSTFMGILILDTCIFVPGTQGGVVAHDLDSAEELFRRNIKFPFDNLPEGLRKGLEPDRSRSKQFVFPNGSSIRVATSLRSGTHQLLHISEFGKVCAKHPDRAQEIVTGTLETVPRDGVAVIESTAEGRSGYFYDYCQEALSRPGDARRTNPLAWEISFFPWWQEPSYVTEPRGVIINAHRRAYFDELEGKIGRKITAGQRAWYVTKASTLGEDMFREYPSTPEESFCAALHGTYYATQIADARREGRITDEVQHEPYLGVETWWDWGMDDLTAIWVVQEVGRKLKVLRYYHNSGETLAHYARVLQDWQKEHGYVYTEHYVPHDMRRRVDVGMSLEDEGAPLTRVQVLTALGLRNVHAVPRTADVGPDIEAVRATLPRCEWHATDTDEGLKGLEAYRKEWDERAGCYKNRPYHDWASNPADAFRTGVIGRAVYPGRKIKAQPVAKRSARGWT